MVRCLSRDDVAGRVAAVRSGVLVSVTSGQFWTIIDRSLRIKVNFITNDLSFENCSLICERSEN